jgi:glutathione S-transferase
MIKIYGRTNAWNVRKVLCLLEDIGLPYEQFDYGRGFKAVDSTEFLALNPNAMVPVLLDGDAVIWESHAILRYIAAKYAPESYYPADIIRRAGVDQWLDWKIAHVAVAVRPLFFRHFLKIGDFTEREVEQGEAQCAKLFTILDAQLGKTGAYAAGSNFTIADCSLGMAVHRYLNLPVRHPELPELSRYYSALSQRPAYQKTVLIGMP